MIILVAMVFLLLVVAIPSMETQDQSGQRIFPTSLSSWTLNEWRMFTPGEQWAYIHGVTVATMTAYNLIAEGYRRGESRDELVQRMVPFYDYLEVNANTIYDRLRLVAAQKNGPYENVPLWTIPYLLAEEPGF